MLGWLIIIILLVLLFSFVFAGKSFAPWVPSRTLDMERIFRLADLKPGEVFYDLGCGNGKMVFYAGQNFDVKAIGIEISAGMYMWCKIRQLFSGKKNIFFKFKNLFKENLSGADVVYIFGMPDTIKKKLKQKFEAELKPGARVVSYVFSVQGWVPAVKDKPSDRQASVYLYKVAGQENISKNSPNSPNF